MIGVGTYIRWFKEPLQAERVLMQHFAQKAMRHHRWDRRQAHMQFVERWAPIFRRHVAPDHRSTHRPNAA